MLLCTLVPVWATCVNKTLEVEDVGPSLIIPHGPLSAIGVYTGVYSRADPELISLFLS